MPDEMHCAQLQPIFDSPSTVALCRARYNEVRLKIAQRFDIQRCWELPEQWDLYEELCITQPALVQQNRQQAREALRMLSVLPRNYFSLWQYW